MREMSAHRSPKVLLFDMGGVCVASPFQVILDYEIASGIPPGWVNYSISKTAPDGFWHRLERGEIPMDSRFFVGFTRDLHNMERWRAFNQSLRDRDLGPPEEQPPLPQIDGEKLFAEMMIQSKRPDPWMFPALEELKASQRYMLGALSNTVIFPPGHELARHTFLDNSIHAMFDFFVSSAHVGLRKPDPRIYHLALKFANEFALAHRDTERGRSLGWEDGIRAEEVLFLDDIGENLRAAKACGFQTIKVPLGRTYEAVDKLEDITGLRLAGAHRRAVVKPPEDNKPKL